MRDKYLIGASLEGDDKELLTSIMKGQVNSNI